MHSQGESSSLCSLTHRPVFFANTLSRTQDSLENISELNAVAPYLLSQLLGKLKQKGLLSPGICGLNQMRPPLFKKKKSGSWQPGLLTCFLPCLNCSLHSLPHLYTFAFPLAFLTSTLLLFLYWSHFTASLSS